MTRKKKEEFIRFKSVACSALNLRSNPSTEAEVIKVLAKDTIVECDKNFKDATWDHIITDPDIEGYCMKEFLVPLNPDTTAALEKEPTHTRNYKCGSKKSKEEIKDDSKKEKED